MNPPDQPWNWRSFLPATGLALVTTLGIAWCWNGGTLVV
jgi:hypothetical protein